MEVRYEDEKRGEGRGRKGGGGGGEEEEGGEGNQRSLVKLTGPTNLVLARA